MGQGCNLLNPFLKHRTRVKNSRGAFSRNREGSRFHEASVHKNPGRLEGVNECWGEYIRLLEKEGWMRGQKISRSHISPRRRARSASAIARSRKCGQTGEILRPEHFRRTDHPVCGHSVASRYLIYAAATPPFQGGECRLIPIHSHLLSICLNLDPHRRAID